MSSASSWREALGAGIGDGLRFRGRTHAIAAVGGSDDGAGFRTREFSLGEDADLYLVIEGDLDGDDPGRCRAILTREIRTGEVVVPVPGGRDRPLPSILPAASVAPPILAYHQRPYRLGRRADAVYRSESRFERRTTWDYEWGRRNLAIERWADGQVAAYEGGRLDPGEIGVVRDYTPPPGSPDGAVVGILVGVAMMGVGLLMLLA